MNEIIIRAPFPAKELNPNSRGHWSKKQRHKKAQKEFGFYAARKFMLPDGYSKRIPVSLIFYPPTKRKFDTDNLAASVKSLLDGIALGLGVNDRLFTPVTAQIVDVDKINPGVAVILSMRPPA